MFACPAAHYAVGTQVLGTLELDMLGFFFLMFWLLEIIILNINLSLGRLIG